MAGVMLLVAGVCAPHPPHLKIIVPHCRYFPGFAVRIVFLDSFFESINIDETSCKDPKTPMDEKPVEISDFGPNTHLMAHVDTRRGVGCGPYLSGDLTTSIPTPNNHEISYIAPIDESRHLGEELKEGR